jgi:hypothetical protein
MTTKITFKNCGEGTYLMNLRTNSTRFYALRQEKGWSSFAYGKSTLHPSFAEAKTACVEKYKININA